MHMAEPTDLGALEPGLEERAPGVGGRQDADGGDQRQGDEPSR
jgi:hypothetical protein